MWIKFINLTKNQFQNKRFYLISLVYLLIFITLLITSIILKKDNENNIIDNFLVSSVVSFCLVLLILVFKWGFMERTFEKFKEQKSLSQKISLEKKLSKMNEIEKKVYLEQVIKKPKQKIFKSNYPFYFNLFIYLILSIIFIIISLV
ncbi:hypothetical protein [Mycoplasmopsis felis]|uniref:hypothetical protein n=1 Tax=Mycoplasmopsis felis TaxID=33923 RepID=UPI003A4DAE49